MAITLSPGASILFIGDRVTDCDWRSRPYGPMGHGYAFLLSSWLSAEFPEHGLSFFNRGRSGDRMTDVADRWRQDAVTLSPAVISILAGVNDTWRRFDRGERVNAVEFGGAYRRILDETRRDCRASVVLCEPFLLPCGRVAGAWFEDLGEKIAVVRALAGEYGTQLVPLSEVFADAARRARPRYWAEDGIHPTPAGHALIARAWLRFVLDMV